MLKIDFVMVLIWCFHLFVYKTVQWLLFYWTRFKSETLVLGKITAWLLNYIEIGLKNNYLEESELLNDTSILDLHKHDKETDIDNSLKAYPCIARSVLLCVLRVCSSNSKKSICVIDLWWQHHLLWYVRTLEPNCVM